MVVGRAGKHQATSALDSTVGIIANSAQPERLAQATHLAWQSQ